MKSKKAVRAFAPLIVVASLLAGCASDSETTDTETTEASAAPAVEEPAVEEPAAEEPAVTEPPTEEPAAEEAATTIAGAAAAPAADLTALAAACTTEAQVNLIALPDEWANYKGILASFRDKYPGVKNPVANPDGSSKDEMEAVKTLAGQKDMPDNVDVSPAIAQEMVAAGMFEPYKASTIADVPTALQDPANNWTASYYGIMAFLTNTTIVKTPPQTFADLKKPEYKGLVSLNGDPREAGSAFAAVMAAAIANGGSADDILPGVKFFAELKKSGNLGGSDVTKATVLSGETPISIDWSYNLPGLRKELQDANLTVETYFPSDGVYGGFYAQGVVKDSPHQACSKLWLEHILSDEGALGYLEGGAIPARFEAIVAAGKVTEDAKKNLPPAELIAQVKFLSAEQITKAKEVLTAQWGPMVADA
jgi:putative spermidine/putrescine transport system substrate-binding protein